MVAACVQAISIKCNNWRARGHGKIDTGRVDARKFTEVGEGFMIVGIEKERLCGNALGQDRFMRIEHNMIVLDRLPIIWKSGCDRGTS